MKENEEEFNKETSIGSYDPGAIKLIKNIIFRRELAISSLIKFFFLPKVSRCNFSFFLNLLFNEFSLTESFKNSCPSILPQAYDHFWIFYTKMRGI